LYDKNFVLVFIFSLQNLQAIMLIALLTLVPKTISGV